jgi:hypothetical protein
MTTLRTLLAGATLTLLATGSAVAADLYPWRNHAPPFNFLFGNEIDTHQQTRQGRDDSLFGFFYVQFTGVVTKDRYGVATHVDCTAASSDCTVGWTLNGKLVKAQFLYHVPPDHPVFKVTRADIPQPGAHAHFHWVGSNPHQPNVAGYLLQLTAVDRFCFIHHGAENATGDRSCGENGGIPVDPGIDIATHLNIVTSYP